MRIKTTEEFSKTLSKKGANSREGRLVEVVVEVVGRSDSGGWRELAS